MKLLPGTWYIFIFKLSMVYHMSPGGVQEIMKIIYTSRFIIVTVPEFWHSGRNTML